MSTEPPSAASPPPAEALREQLIALPESRELEVFAALLGRRGARVLRVPLIAIHDAPDPQPVRAWLAEFLAGGYHDLILITGEGLQRLLGALERWQPEQRPAFLQALARVRKITRGPKPARALRALGLAADLEAPVPTTAGVIAALRALPLQGRTVGVQLYGTDPNLPLQEFLRSSGAQVRVVAPYVYAEAIDDEAVRELIARLGRGEIAAIAFTSKAQLERLCAVCGTSTVRTALAATQVAVIGPVVAAALTERGMRVDGMPHSSWSMKPLSAELARLLAAAGGRSGV